MTLEEARALLDRWHNRQPGEHALVLQADKLLAKEWERQKSRTAPETINHTDLAPGCLALRHRSRRLPVAGISSGRACRRGKGSAKEDTAGRQADPF
jgi:hypothetical protein